MPGHLGRCRRRRAKRNRTIRTRCARQPGSRAPVSRSGARRGRGAVHDILLVDDEPEFTAVVRSILEEEGHSVRTARDGGSAIAQLVERLPDVIILDVGMPGIGGGGVLACIRGMSASKDVPVVMLTSNTRRECVQKIARLGVSAYLSKAAFSPDGLMNAIRAVIAHPPDTRAMGHRRVSARAKAHRAPSGPSPDRAAEVAPQVLNRN